MLESLFSIIAPHYCISCGEFGDGLCDYCKYDIELVPCKNCLLCEAPLLRATWCQSCELTGIGQFIGGNHDGILARVIEMHKFQPARRYVTALVMTLDRCAAVMPLTHSWCLFRLRRRTSGNAALIIRIRSLRRSRNVVS